MSFSLMVMHLTMLGAYGYTAYHAFFLLKIPVVDNKFEKFNPGQLKYLTIWGVVSDNLKILFFFLNMTFSFFRNKYFHPLIFFLSRYISLDKKFYIIEFSIS